MRLIPLTLASLMLFSTVAQADGSAAAGDGYAPPAVVRGNLARDLAHKGRDEKITGGILIGLSSALLATSIALNVVDDANLGFRDCPYFSSACGGGVARGPLWIGSMATFLIGVPTLGAGIATYVVGGYHMNKARRLQLVSVAAAPAPDGGAVAATFRF